MYVFASYSSSLFGCCLLFLFPTIYSGFENLQEEQRFESQSKWNRSCTTQIHSMVLILNCTGVDRDRSTTKTELADDCKMNFGGGFTWIFPIFILRDTRRIIWRHDDDITEHVLNGKLSGVYCCCAAHKHRSQSSQVLALKPAEQVLVGLCVCMLVVDCSSGWEEAKI